MDQMGQKHIAGALKKRIKQLIGNKKAGKHKRDNPAEL